MGPIKMLKMKLITYLSCCLFSVCFSVTNLYAQSANNTSGSNASGSGGTVSYSIGQVVFSAFTGTNGTVYQGVQQPYEISVVTSVNNIDEILLECLVFPNPTDGQVKLVVKAKDSVRLRYQLYDLNGKRLLEHKIDNEETDISMVNRPSSTYILKVLSGSQEIKVFKIIKN
jgi:hypothetical protein